MSDKGNVKFTNYIFAEGDYRGLVQFGDQDFKDTDFAWDLALYIAKFNKISKEYDKLKNKLIKKFSGEIEDPKTKEVTIGIRPGSPENEKCLEEIEKLNARSITIEGERPVITKDKLGKTVNASVTAMAIPFLDVR